MNVDDKNLGGWERYEHPGVGLDLAIPGNKEFSEIPHDVVAQDCPLGCSLLLLLEPLEQGDYLRPIHMDLSKDIKAVCIATSLGSFSRNRGDFLMSAWLLLSKLIAGEETDGKARTAEFFMQLPEAIIPRSREASCGCDVCD